LVIWPLELTREVGRVREYGHVYVRRRVSRAAAVARSPDDSRPLGGARAPRFGEHVTTTASIRLSTPTRTMRITSSTAGAMSPRCSCTTRHTYSWCINRCRSGSVTLWPGSAPRACRRRGRCRRALHALRRAVRPLTPAMTCCPGVGLSLYRCGRRARSAHVSNERERSHGLRCPLPGRGAVAGLTACGSYVQTIRPLPA
jgi:hypothetical protein